ncbi:hypothetical protein Cadr_000031188 [Camelus dromedarius]|uniref:Uncharacterized protein n=1 Tax=Camelus dromedarius TaxID=9838 RepID=A0A5N4BXA6_CAMDR|nr:hypothetical protein Cadr_000031188 [Camelus dromedarius]
MQRHRLEGWTREVKLELRALKGYRMVQRQVCRLLRGAPESVPAGPRVGSSSSELGIGPKVFSALSTGVGLAGSGRYKIRAPDRADCLIFGA